MISASFTSGAGQIELSIDDGASNVTSEIVNMGVLKYDFDQTPDVLSIDRVQAVYNPFNVDIARFDDMGNDLYLRLIEATVTGSEAAKINVDMHLTDFESNLFKFTFSLRNSDIETDERSRSIRLKLNPRLNLEANNGQFFSNASKITFDAIIPLSNVGATESAIFPMQCMGAGSYISGALPLVFDNDFETIVKSGRLSPTAFLFDDTPTTNTGNLQFVMVNVHSDDGFIANGEELPDAVGAGSVTINSTLDQRFFHIYNSEISQEAAVGIRAVSVGTAKARIILSGGDFIAQGVSEGSIINADGYDWAVVNVVNSATLDVESLNSIERLPPTSTLINVDLLIIKEGVTTEFPKNTKTFEQLGFETQYANGAIYSITRRLKPEEIKVIDTLKEMAGIEGSIFGTGFSKNFYINRLRNDPATAVTILYDEVIDLKPKPFNLALGGSKITQLTDSRRLYAEFFGVWGTSFTDPLSVQPRVPNLWTATKYAVGNPNATKAIEIELPAGYPFLNKGFAVGGDPPPPPPVINIEGISLRYDANRAGDSCIAGSSTTFYANNAISLGFEGIIDLFQDDTGSTFADTGWYSNGTIVRYWNNSGEISEAAFTEQYDCASIPGVG